MSARNYVASAAESDGVFLSMMNLSPATVHSSPRRNARQFFEQIIGHVDAPMRDERWRSAQRVAHRTLFCDDLVYLEGGPPVYFGVCRGTVNDRILLVEVGMPHRTKSMTSAAIFPALDQRNGVTRLVVRWSLGLKASGMGSIRFGAAAFR